MLKTNSINIMLINFFLDKMDVSFNVIFFTMILYHSVHAYMLTLLLGEIEDLESHLSQPHRRGIRRGLVPLYFTGSSSRRQFGPHRCSAVNQETSNYNVFYKMQTAILNPF